MDPEFIRQWAPILLAVAVFGWNIRLYFSGARKDELKALRERIDAVSETAAELTDALAEELKVHKEDGTASRAELRERLGQVEQTLKAMPTNETVHELALAVTEIKGLIATQSEALKAVAATAHRVETFLLERKA